MNDPAGSPKGSPEGPPGQTQGRRRKPLNLTLIKAVIVFVAGLCTATVSAFTGLGANLAFAPMLTWMLGFRAEKAQATALRFAVFTVAFAVAVALATGLLRPALLASGLVLTIGATIGAILSAGISQLPSVQGIRRIFLTLGMALMLFVIMRTSQQGQWSQASFYAEWNSPLALLALGTAAGALTQITGLASGLLLVPGLMYLSAFPAKEAILLSLMVMALAALLPVLAHARSGLADETYGTPIMVSGILGGILGSLCLARLPASIAVYAFAVIAMFLCAREMAYGPGSPAVTADRQEP